jgi:hypothetical protein
LLIGACISPDGSSVYTDGNVDFWAGALDDIRIHNRAMGDSEVAALYAFEAAVPEPSWWGLAIAGLLGAWAVVSRRRRVGLAC